MLKLNRKTIIRNMCVDSMQRQLLYDIFGIIYYCSLGCGANEAHAFCHALASMHKKLAQWKKHWVIYKYTFGKTLWHDFTPRTFVRIWFSKNDSFKIHIYDYRQAESC